MNRHCIGVHALSSNLSLSVSYCGGQMHTYFTLKKDSILPFLKPNNATRLSKKNLLVQGTIISNKTLILIMPIPTQAFRFCIESLI